MKKILIAAAVAVFATVGAASAQDYAIVGSSEWAIEAKTLETNVGVDFYVNDFTFTPSVDVDYTSATKNMAFTGVNFNVGYAVSDQSTVYLKVEADRDFKYEEAYVGVSFKF